MALVMPVSLGSGHPASSDNAMPRAAQHPCSTIVDQTRTIDERVDQNRGPQLA